MDWTKSVPGAQGQTWRPTQTTGRMFGIGGVGMEFTVFNLLSFSALRGFKLLLHECQREKKILAFKF